MTRTATFLACATSALAIATAAQAADPELTVLDWAGWEIDGMLQPYVDKHGQKPSYVFFADDDEAFQKVSSGFKADVVHPCAASVPRYKEAGLVEPWDTSRITEFANIPERMVKPFTNDDGVFFIRRTMPIPPSPTTPRRCRSRMSPRSRSSPTRNTPAACRCPTTPTTCGRWPSSPPA